MALANPNRGKSFPPVPEHASLPEMSTSDQGAKKNGWIRPTIEYGPVVLFFIALKIWGLMPATTVLIVTSLLAVGFGYVRERRLAWGAGGNYGDRGDLRRSHADL